MKIKKLLHGQGEYLIYLTIWFVIFVAPVVSLYIRAAEDSRFVFEWHLLFPIWKVDLLLFAAFLIHNFLLAPLLIKHNMRKTYTLGVVVLLATFVTVQYQTRPMRHMHHRERFRTEMREANDRDDDEGPRKEHIRHDPPLMVGQVDLMSAITVIFLLGMNLGVKLYFRWIDERKQNEELEKQNLKQQLEYLKYQINPHFFMNTLNNIHALVDIDPTKAKDSIVVLSRMMRYLLYESDNTMVTLQKEIEFLKSYIDLMSMRYTSKVHISLRIDGEDKPGNIPPLLLITFVENAFKHGVSYREESFIRVTLSIADDALHFTCANSRHDEQPSQRGGVGLDNVRKRLDLIYKSRYYLSIEAKPETYEVMLRLPLGGMA